MKKIKLAISGCLGRMGQQLIKSSKKDKNFKLITLTENKLIKKKFNKIKPQLNSNEAFQKTDVIIDFTVPNFTLDILKIASELKKKSLSAQLDLIKIKKTKLENTLKKFLY